jgi:hypothetical protein
MRSPSLLDFGAIDIKKLKMTCPDVGYVPVLDTVTTPTFIIILNCVIFSNYYQYRRVSVHVVSPCFIGNERII